MIIYGVLSDVTLKKYNFDNFCEIFVLHQEMVYVCKKQGYNMAFYSILFNVPKDSKNVHRKSYLSLN